MDVYFQDESGQWFWRRNYIGKTGRELVTNIKVYPKNCEQCGKEFVDRHTAKKLCSNECNYASQKGKHKKPEGPRQCPICGTDFYRKVRGPWRKTCSPKCARALGDQFRGVPGPMRANWKGGRRYQTKSGYVMVYAGAGLHSRLEHRIIMEEVLGRSLECFEEVHHKNGIRNDNRPENLELWVRRQPTGARAEDLIEFAHWILDTYGPIEDRL